MSTIERREYDLPDDVATHEGQVGLAYQTRTGRFWEFLDPDTHDDYMRLRHPRSGDTWARDAGPKGALKQSMAGMMLGKVDAEAYAEFRDTYVNAAEGDYARAEARMKRLIKE